MSIDSANLKRLVFITRRVREGPRVNPLLTRFEVAFFNSAGRHGSD